MTEEQVREALRAAANGNVSEWARMNRISQAYASDVLNGRRAPGDRILDALCLRRVVTYEHAT